MSTTPSQPSTPDQLTLRQRLTESERMVAEIEEHLGRGFLPKVKALRKLVKSPETDGTEVRDLTVRQAAEQVLRTEDFTDDLYRKLVVYLTSIGNSVAELLEDDDPTDSVAE